MRRLYCRRRDITRSWKELPDGSGTGTVQLRALRDQAGSDRRSGGTGRGDSSSVANTLSAQGAGEMDAEATTEADGGRPGCDRAAAQGRLGRASDRAGAWPVAQRDQRGARPRHGRLLRRRAGTGRGGSAVGPVGTSGKAGVGQPVVCRGGEAAAAAVVAGADRGEAQAPGGWNGSVVRTTSVARGDLPGDLRRAAR